MPVQAPCAEEVLHVLENRFVFKKYQATSLVVLNLGHRLLSCSVILEHLK